MKLTDEKVAKALGWKLLDSKGHLWKMDGVRGSRHGVPKYTTDLNFIVAEVENKPKMRWELHRLSTTTYTASVWEQGKRFTPYQQAPTAPLALCAALLAYLKEHP